MRFSCAQLLHVTPIMVFPALRTHGEVVGIWLLLSNHLKPRSFISSHSPTLNPPWPASAAAF